MNDCMEAVSGELRAAPRRPKRAVFDEILIAFHYACDLRDYDVAKRLLLTVESALRAQESQPGFNRKRALDTLLAAHERLWTLTHEVQDQAAGLRGRPAAIRLGSVTGW